MPPLGLSLRWKSGDEEKGNRSVVSSSQSSDTKEQKDHALRRHGSRRSIDPTAAIPIEYRSISFEIEDESERQKISKRAAGRDKLAEEWQTTDWHTVSTVEAQKRLNVDVGVGLSASTASELLRKNGKNKISPLPNPWFWKIFGYFFKGFGSILLVGGILVFISWKPLGEPPAVANLALGIVLIAVFLIQAAFNGWQDWSSSRVMASITAMLPESCQLLRDGSRVEVMATEIVKGDTVFLKSGTKIPADVRFVEVSHDFSVDRSIVTGESSPVKGSIDSTSDNYLETCCIGLQGTHCVSGKATGIVVATGDSTVFGRIAKLAGEPSTGLTTIEKEILRFVGLIFIIMITWIVILAAVWGGWLHKKHPDYINVATLIVDCVSVAIAYIPEGLPIAVTASLTITANIMRKNKVLCKSLKTVETLGSVSVICTDKTGTLTKNRMDVTDLSVSTVKAPFNDRMDTTAPIGPSALQQLRAMGALCNAAEFDQGTATTPLRDRRVFGDATDQAVLRFSESLGSVDAVRKSWKVFFDLAFDSKNKFMIKAFTPADSQSPRSWLTETEAGGFGTGDILFTIKGAPDILIDRCTQTLTPDGEVKPLDGITLTAVKQLKDQWSSEGKRVILFARKVLAKESIWPDPTSSECEAQMLSQSKGGLTLVGLVGMIDPPRAEIPEVMRVLRQAHIRVFMVTGDFGLTALAISRQCGLVTADAVEDASALARFPSSTEKEITLPKSALLISGPDLMGLNEYQWEQLCKYREIVFSRTTPHQKLRIVRELQSRDEIVGMTGDGVNDAPALKAADIGISLASGSDIAIEAADMVLLESFAAIVEAVRYGRVVFDNLKKTVAYLLPAGSWSEFWPVFTNLIFGIPQILSSFLMIIICCFTDCAAAVALAYEKPEADVLFRPPRHPTKTRLVNWKLMFHSYAIIGMIETVCSFSMAFWYLQRKGIPFSDLWFKFGEIPAGMDQDYYTARVNEASSIYFINLVIMQWFNLMAVRTRHLSIFQHPPAFNKATQNLYLFPAMICALGIAVIWLYIPSLQRVLDTAGPPAEHYFLPAALGLGLLCLDEGRKAAVRRWPNGILAKMAW
ncbi:hypothetical protein N7456_012485 [Penicillium angulare]|uniref:Cation-transporting P-type ATPase N-terminal domain-containing protein n=1 Tax=Penicillium angulare TaxID=116970 RepID=A0A9W9EVV5_9EURO|nr:hypothetical protein N7456_012485 [Penicillium angulare]